MSEDRFDEIARRAGAELRRPAPADGLARVRATRRRRQIVGVGAVTAAAALVGGGVIVWAAQDGDRTVAIDSTPSTSATNTTVAEPTTAASTPPPTTEATQPTAPTTSPPATSAPATTVPEALPTSPGGSVSYLSPPPALDLRPIGEVELVVDANAWIDVAIGDLGVVVNQTSMGFVSVVNLAGTERRVPVEDTFGALTYGPGDTVYGLRQGDTMQEFAMVAVPLQGDQTGGVVASQLVPIVQYTELPNASFGHGSTGIIDRERAVNQIVMPYVDTAGRPMAWTEPVPPLLTTTGDLNSPDVSIASDAGTSWRLDIEASPTRASPFISDPPAAPSSSGLVVYSTHIGPNAKPDQDFGEPTMFVLAAMYPDGSVQWRSIPDGWQVVASDVWGTVLAKRTGQRLELALAEIPGADIDGAPATVDFASLVGREWTSSDDPSSLGLSSQWRLGNQGIRNAGGIHEIYDEASQTDPVFGGHHVVLLSDVLTDPGEAPARMVVSAVLDLHLADDEQLSLAHIGCWVDDAYDEGVFATIAPPTVDGSPDLSAHDWPARRAWRYAVSGPPVEIDPGNVACEPRVSEPGEGGAVLSPTGAGSTDLHLAEL